MNPDLMYEKLISLVDITTKIVSEITKLGFKVELDILHHAGYFAQSSPRNCLKFMFTSSLSNHVGSQTELSRNNAIFSIQFTFSRFEICLTTLSRFFSRGPPKLITALYLSFFLPLIDTMVF